MPDIQILSPHLADLIAAGEVVERPASVVKELVENAFDAGARTVTVELRGGGATYLRVTDDGCGMAPEDAGIAFLRHATSKLHDAQGLEAIGTMGFRGEALAAISAVSHITLTTRQRGAASGTHMTLDAGDIHYRCKEQLNTRMWFGTGHSIASFANGENWADHLKNFIGKRILKREIKKEQKRKEV